MGFPAQLVLRDLDCTQQLQFGREQRSFLLVRGPAGAEDVCAITGFRSPWPLYLSLSLPLSSPIQRSGPNRFSFSLVWKREKIEVPSDKPYITFLGLSGASKTILTWDDTANSAGSTYKSASTAVKSIGFIARGITFKVERSEFNRGASRGSSGKTSCGIYDRRPHGSVLQLLFHWRPRHFNCNLNVIADANSGSLTAQKRSSAEDDSGFAFVGCTVGGRGPMYLGRAWGPYSRVVFIKTWFADVILPEGCYDWGESSRQKTVFYWQYDCSGPGSDSSKQVDWATTFEFQCFKQIVMGLPRQLVSWDLDCRQQLQCRREQRSSLSVRGLGGAQDICAILVFRSPWPIYPSLSLPLSSHIRGSGPIRCSPFSSVWKRSPSNSNASVNYSQLKNFGKSNSRIVRDGGTTELTRCGAICNRVQWQQFGFGAGKSKDALHAAVSCGCTHGY